MDGGFFFLNLLLIGGGIVVRNYLNEQRRKRAKEPSDWPQISITGPQIAGFACAECKKNIVFHTDGRHCDHCQQPMHHDCLTRHQTESLGPYR